MENLQEKNSFYNVFPHLIGNAQKNQNLPIIMGHRGGFKPENTLLSFYQAKLNKLRAIELDVWITKDGELAVIHGGQNGQMPSHDENEDPMNPSEGLPLIFEMTLDEAQSYFKTTPEFRKFQDIQSRLIENENIFNLGHLSKRDLLNEKMILIPTLQEVFEILDCKVLVNIEVKLPNKSPFIEKYEIVNKSQIMELHKFFVADLSRLQQSFISSFNWNFIDEFKMFQRANRDEYQDNSLTKLEQEKLTRFIYLHSKNQQGDLPSHEETNEWDVGANLSLEVVDSKVLNRFQQNKQLLGIWTSKYRDGEENEEIWKKILNINRLELNENGLHQKIEEQSSCNNFIDFFCSDLPLQFGEYLSNNSKLYN